MWWNAFSLEHRHRFPKKCYRTYELGSCQQVQQERLLQHKKRISKRFAQWWSPLNPGCFPMIVKVAQSGQNSAPNRQPVVPDWGSRRTWIARHQGLITGTPIGNQPTGNTKTNQNQARKCENNFRVEVGRFGQTNTTRHGRLSCCQCFIWHHEHAGSTREK